MVSWPTHTDELQIETKNHSKNPCATSCVVTTIWIIEIEDLTHILALFVQMLGKYAILNIRKYICIINFKDMFGQFDMLQF